MAGRTRPPPLARVLERVTATSRREGLFDPGDLVLVAVSGGPDSVCLVEALVRLRRLLRIRLEVLHVDHRLRPDSGADARYVQRLAARHALPCHVRVAQGRPAPGESVESWARAQRHAAAGEVRAATGACTVALGHTLDDQAETVLLALLTGSGLRGLAGIAPASPPWVNPLLDVTRDEVEVCCRALHLRPRHDPTNDDRRFLRNAVRLDLLPAAARVLDRDVTGAIVRTATGLREDAEELQRQALAALPAVLDARGPDPRLRAGALRDLPPAIAGRVIAQAVYAAGAVCTRADVDAVRDLVVGRPGRRRHLSGGLVAHRDRTGIDLRRA